MLARLVLDRRVLLAAIVVLAVIVRLAGVGDRLSIDEGYSWLVGGAPSASAFLDRLAAYENTPPLFYLLLTPLPLDDEVWIRLPALLAGAASVPVLYAAVRPLLGTPTALLSALGLAVAPYYVQFSNYSRGFTLATLGLLIALWGAARLARGAQRSWWWLYGAGAVLALYSEYDSSLFLLPLVGALLVIGKPARRETLLFGLLPFLALLPWIGEFQHSRDLSGVTKVDPTNPGLSLGTLRNETVALVFSEQGIAASRGLKTALYAAVILPTLLAGIGLARRAREAFWLLAGTGLGVLAGHAITSAMGPDILAARYLIPLLPLGVAVLAAGVAAAPWRSAVPVVAALLVGAGAFVFLNREGREVDPDYERVAAIVEGAHARVVLTNSAVVTYYLDRPRPLLDRPFGLGPGLTEGCLRSCRRPLAIVDDGRVPPARRVSGRATPVDDIFVVIVPKRH
jgi:4-amino-4-deoxy-L-arabinose transferase-like glycosyltransferase